MGDRCFVSLHLSGPILTVPALLKLGEALADWNCRPTIYPSFYHEIYAAIDTGLANFGMEEVNYGDTFELEDELAKLGMGFVIRQSPGDTYGAQNRAYWPELGHHFMTTIDECEGAVVPIREIRDLRKERQDETGLAEALDELILKTDRATGEGLPSLRVSDVVRGRLEEMMRELDTPHTRQPSVDDWRRAVASGLTTCGYDEWLSQQGSKG